MPDPDNGNNIAALQRPGLRPLPVHVAAIMAAQAKDPGLLPGFARDMAAMIEGIKRYQEHPFRRPASTAREVWREGQARLLFSPASGTKKGPAIFLIPSMINRAAILDLIPERSFTRWLTQQGRDVYMIDWGNPVDDPGMQELDGVIRDRLASALTQAAALSGGPMDAVGYCMGGTLLAGVAVHAPKPLHRLVFLASPWDFHAGDRILTSHIQAGTPSALQAIESKGFLSADWIQSVFAVVSAERTVKKFADFARMTQNEPDAEIFVAVEDWLNDGVDFPGGVAHACIVGWYSENQPGRGAWKIGRKTINPAKIKIPSLVVASSNDRLVPAVAAQALAALLPQCSTIRPAIGHIGMMSGRRALVEIWQPVLSWLSADMKK